MGRCRKCLCLSMFLCMLQGSLRAARNRCGSRGLAELNPIIPFPGEMRVRVHDLGNCPVRVWNGQFCALRPVGSRKHLRPKASRRRRIQCEFERSLQLNAAQYSSIQLNAAQYAQHNSIQLNAAQYSLLNAAEYSLIQFRSSI